jgi:hypothetical protein
VWEDTTFGRLLENATFEMEWFVGKKENASQKQSKAKQSKPHYKSGFAQETTNT